jgi:hypothetical protein
MCNFCKSIKAPAKTSTERKKNSRKQLASRSDNPEVTAHGPVTADERDFIRYLDNCFIHRGVQVAKEPPIIFTQTEIEEMVDYSGRRTSEKFEPINFDSEINPGTKRNQRKLWSNFVATKWDEEGDILEYQRYDLVRALNRRIPLPECLVRVVRMLLLWHGLETLIVIKALASEPGCGRQFDHYDDPTQSHFRRLQYFDRQYSAMIATESNTTMNYPLGDDAGAQRAQLQIAQGRMLIWEAGKWVHAGSDYNEINRRLFISVSSPMFPISEKVETVGADVEKERFRLRGNPVDRSGEPMRNKRRRTK